MEITTGLIKTEVIVNCPENSMIFDHRQVDKVMSKKKCVKTPNLIYCLTCFPMQGWKAEVNFLVVGKSRTLRGGQEYLWGRGGDPPAQLLNPAGFLT